MPCKYVFIKTKVMKNSERKNPIFSIKIPPDLMGKIRKEAHDQDRSIAYIIIQVLKNHFRILTQKEVFSAEKRVKNSINKMHKIINK